MNINATELYFGPLIEPSTIYPGVYPFFHLTCWDWKQFGKNTLQKNCGMTQVRLPEQKL